jgi:aspartate/methionine/tyrosine aminotransferase
MKSLSKVANNLEGQPMFQILEIAKAMEKSGRRVFHFELGDPDFSTPPSITSAGINSLLKGETHYTPSSGILELKQAAQDVTLRSRGFKPYLKQLLVTPGANAQLFYAIACTVNPGEQVMVPDPGFVSYYSILKMLGILAIRIPLKEENNFRLDPQDVEDAITPATRMIIMNSPSNPTGSVMTKDEVRHMYDIAEEHDLYLLSDEIYARMAYDKLHHSPSVYDHCKHRTILVNGFSKSYAMTGWRLGVCTGPEDVIGKMGLMLETTTSCVPEFVQKAGIEALKGHLKENAVQNMMDEFKKRRDVIVEGLNSLPGVTCNKPDGAFYVFPNITGTNLCSDSFAQHMIYNANVAVCSGNIFGEFGEGYIRMSYANNSIENIKDAIEKMRYIL